nr:hypothetical protein [Tanacetum cinerariifolium]
MSLRYETGEKKVNEVDFISQGVELVSRKLATMKNLSETQLEHEKKDELVTVVHECKHWIGSGDESFWEEGDDFRVDVLHFHTCLT